MNIIIAQSSRLSAARYAIVLLLAAFVTTSCSTLNKKSGGYTEYSGGPVNYPSDGNYHPYQQGKVQPAPSKPAPQESSPNVSDTPSASDSPPAAKSAGSSTAKKKSGTTTSTKSSASSTTHIVKHGDTFYGLAKKYHTTVAALKKANNKTSDILRDGEKIKIP